MLVRIVPLSLTRAPSFRNPNRTTTALTQGGWDQPCLRSDPIGRKIRPLSNRSGDPVRHAHHVHTKPLSRLLLPPLRRADVARAQAAFLRPRSKEGFLSGHAP